MTRWKEKRGKKKKAEKAKKNAGRKKRIEAQEKREDIPHPSGQWIQCSFEGRLGGGKGRGKRGGISTFKPVYYTVVGRDSDLGTARRRRCLNEKKKKKKKKKREKEITKSIPKNAESKKKKKKKEWKRVCARNTYERGNHLRLGGKARRGGQKRPGREFLTV